MRVSMSSRVGAWGVSVWSVVMVRGLLGLGRGPACLRRAGPRRGLATVRGSVVVVPSGWVGGGLGGGGRARGAGGLLGVGGGGRLVGLAAGQFVGGHAGRRELVLGRDLAALGRLVDDDQLGDVVLGPLRRQP